MKKQMEGDSRQRRRRARQARRQGRTPSEEGVTTGGSDQIYRVRSAVGHVGRLLARARGKQADRLKGKPRPGSR